MISLFPDPNCFVHLHRITRIAQGTPNFFGLQDSSDMVWLLLYMLAIWWLTFLGTPWDWVCHDISGQMPSKKGRTSVWDIYFRFFEHWWLIFAEVVLVVLKVFSAPHSRTRTSSVCGGMLDGNGPNRSRPLQRELNMWLSSGHIFSIWYVCSPDPTNFFSFLVYVFVPLLGAFYNVTQWLWV